MFEHNTTLRVKKYIKMILNTNDDEINIITWSSFPQGVTNSAAKCVVKFIHNSERNMITNQIETTEV